MAKNTGKFIIDQSISAEMREKISEKVDSRLEQMKSEVADRVPVLQKRQDFYEGRHHKWTNVINQTIKQQEGHIMAVFNYILRFCLKLQHSLTNSPPKIKVKPFDESNDIEVVRAEAVETAIYKVLQDNQFFPMMYKKLACNQVRDGDFALECKVMEEGGKRRIVIAPQEDLSKVMVGWDDASGTSFSSVVFSDLWSVDKIKRDFGYDAEPITDKDTETGTKGDHLTDQYGIFAQNGVGVGVPQGKTNLPKARIVDYWGYEVVKNEVKVINVIKINKELVQLVITDYKKIPKFIGHSIVVAGKPWSMGFIDALIDPQIELNDRTGEEGDLVRIGAHAKFLAVNMPDFDPNSVKPGSGQVIFIEGDNADFRPLQTTLNTFPSESYLNRVMEHMFNMGLPKIALAAGTAPYTGKVAATQYQAVVDWVTDFRQQWEIVMDDLFRTIQEYLIDYFPETKSFMTESILDEQTGEITDGDVVVRDLEFDWENVLPLSRSDKVIDASTMRDRGAISLDTYLEEAGFRDPSKEIKKLKKESKDPDMVVLGQRFGQFSKGAVEAELEAQKALAASQEANAATIGQATDAASAVTPKATPPILNSSQNGGERRGIASGMGTPTGQTSTPEGAMKQVQQNLNAKNGV